MKTISKFLFFGVLMFFATSIIAQQTFVNQTGVTAPNKVEMLKALHGPTVYVEEQTEGSGRAVGDNCANPILIGSLPYNDLSQTTAGRGNTYSNTCLNDFDGGEDIIYQLTLLTETTIVVELDPNGTAHTGIAISDGCPLDATCLAISADISGSGTAHGFTITLDAGVYYIMVDTWPFPTSIPSFDLSITTGSLAINDDCSDAIAIGEVLDMPFNSANATDDIYGNVESANIWYNYTASFTGTAIISLCGSDFDTQLAVWDGFTCPPTTELTFGDDSPNCDLQSEVTLAVVTGGQYKIEIGGFDGDSGEGLLSIYEQAACTLTQPGGAVLEGEPCGSDLNGGCNMAVPTFKTVNNGNVVWGNLWSDGGTRDTDWFKIVLTKPSDLKMTVKSEAVTTFGLVGQVELGVAGCENITGALSVYQNAYPCEEDSIKVLFLPKGTYYLFVGLYDYYNHACSGVVGVDYIASFSFTQVPSGTLAGTIKDASTLLPIQGVKITAGDYFGYTNASGVYNIPVPVDTYTVDADGYPVGYSSDTYPGAVVTNNTFTYVDFLLEKLSAPTLLTAVAGVEEVTLTWAPSVAKNGRALMGDISTSSLYTASSTVTLDFTMSIYSPDFEWGNYCELTLPVGLTPTSATTLNGISASIVGNVVSYTGLFYDANTPEEITFSVTVNAGAISGPKYIDYLVEGDGSGGTEHFFEGTMVVYQNGGSYVPVYKIYRQKGREYIYITSIINQTTYVDGIIPGGDEWCYQVTQIFEDLSESAPSNILCATPLILPGSTCESPFVYGPVNNPAMTGTLIRDTDVRWYEFTVPYTMDVAISLCGSDFDTQLALYEDCADYTGTLPVGALAYSGDNVNWCGSNRSQIEYQMLPGGTYYAAVYGDNGEFADYEIHIQQIQILQIRNGWSGISTYMNPSGSANIANVLENSTDSLIIVIAQNPYGIYWPSQNTNSIGNITPEKGYKAKMSSSSLYKRTDLIYGAEVVNKTVNIPKGVSYLPVKVTGLTNANHIVTALGANLMLMFDMFNNKIIWPAGGILPGNPGSIDFLIPGHAYLINMTNAASYTYPMPAFGPVHQNPEEPYRSNKTNWNDVINTGVSHFISISENAQREFQTGDVVGVFNTEGICVGISEFTGGGNLFIAANGDDELTEATDGLTAGEEMTFKLYRSNLSVYELAPTYSSAMPNSDGLFAIEGMSLITEFKLSATEINENELSSMNVYPNPSTGVFNIKGLGSNVKMTVSNAQGQELYSKLVSGNTQLDLTAQPKGIYFIKFMSNNSTRVEKVVIK